MDMKELSSILQQNGIVGAGGAGFPTYAKLDERAETIILNCAECEPYLTADYRRMLENPEELIGGMKIVLRLFDHAKGILGVEDNKPDCIQKLKELTKDEERIEVMPLKTKYPQGGERQLIYATTGRAINSKMMISGSNVLILDEPTDHLDMESITALNNGMIKFPGVLLFSSRDHQIVQTTANRIMEIVPGGKLIDKITTYDEYLESDEMARKRQVYSMSSDDENDN